MVGHKATAMIDAAVGVDVGKVAGRAVELTPKTGALPRSHAGQCAWASRAQYADMFTGTHGRQAMQGDSAPKALDLGHVLTSGAVWWVTTAVVALMIAVFVLHRHIRSHHLRSRVRYDLLPTTSFEPSAQAVLGFAHQLGRARPVRGWVPKSVVGVRIRFSTDEAYGKMLMSVEGRESITGVINKLVYPDVEIRRTERPGRAGEGETTLDGQGGFSSEDRAGETAPSRFPEK